MKTRAAILAAAIIASILSSAYAVAQPDTAEPAPTADRCLTSPREYSPPGTRWRYRVERSTGRRCWFLKDDAEKTAGNSGKSAERSSTATEDVAPPSRSKKSAAPPSVSDARAEFSHRPVEPSERPSPAESAPAPAPPSTSSADSNQLSSTRSANVLAPTTAARWSNPASTAAPQIPAANPAPPPVEQSAEQQPAPPPVRAQVMPRAVPPMPLAEKPMSWPMLITVVAGGFSVFAVLVSMLLALVKSRKARASNASMPAPVLPGQLRRPGDLYRTRKQWKEWKSGRRAA